MAGSKWNSSVALVVCVVSFLSRDGVVVQAAFLKSKLRSGARCVPGAADCGQAALSSETGNAVSQHTVISGLSRMGFQNASALPMGLAKMVLASYVPTSTRARPMVSSLLDQATPIQQHILQGPAGNDSPDVPVGTMTYSNNFDNFVKKNPLALFCTGLLWAALVGLVALFYDNEKKFPPDVTPGEHEPLPDGQWRFSLFGCFEEKTLCALTCCCGPIRWSDTIRMAGFMKFWMALGFLLGLQVLNSVMAPAGGVVILFAAVYYRQKLRTFFNMPSGTAMTILEDCFTYCCCSCCAMVQEARQIEEAYQTQHKSVAVLQKSSKDAAPEAASSPWVAV